MSDCKFQLSLKSLDGTVLLNCYADTAEEFKAQITELQIIKATITPVPIVPPKPSVYEQRPSEELGCGICGSQDINAKSGVKNGRQWSGKFCNGCGAANFGRGWNKKQEYRNN